MCRTGDIDRLSDGAHRLVHAQLDRGRESPGALMYHAHTEADVFAVMGTLQPTVPQRHLLATDPLHPEVSVFDTQFLRAFQRGVGERPHRQGEEGGVHPERHSPEPSRTGPAGIVSGGVMAPTHRLRR